MTLEPLATADDLAARLGVGSYSGAELAQVNALLEDASAELRGVIGSQINRMTSTATLWADRKGQVELPASPVISVDSVQLDGTEVDSSEYRLRYRTLHLPVACRDDELTVTFTHGWEPIPDELVKWTCVLAAAALNAVEQTDALGLTAGVSSISEKIDDYQVSWQTPEAAGGDGASGMTLPKRVVDRLRASYGSGGIAWLEVDG